MQQRQAHRIETRSHVPASIVQHGTTLSQALLHELVGVLDATFAREKARIRVTWALVVAIAVSGSVAMLAVDARYIEIKIAAAAVALAVPAFVRLAWGVLNRALLDAAAATAAVDRNVLQEAVEQMKRHVDAEEALYVALYAPRSPVPST